MATAEPVLCQARVSHPYQADSDKELTLIEGETIEVLQQDGDWWRGKGTSGMGWFPKDYVEEATSGMMMGDFSPDGGNLMGAKPPPKTTKNKTGLVPASEIVKEAELRRKEQEERINNMSAETSGKNAKTLVRDKTTGRLLTQEEIEERKGRAKDQTNNQTNNSTNE